MPTLSAFIRSIRRKDEWYLKITSENRSEIEDQWVKEAGLAPDVDVADSPASNTDTNLIYAALRELEEEAKRIRFYDHTVQPSSRRLPPRNIDFTRIKQDVDRELCFIENAQCAITAPLFRRHDPVGVFASNGLVPVSLCSELSEEMNRLAALHPRDLRPESDRTSVSGATRETQDLISPSLYPFVANLSRLRRDPSTTEPNFVTCLRRSNKHYSFSSSYSWIPSIFTVSADEKDACIESYINGLGPRENFPELYRLIELVFLFVLPHLKRTAKAVADCDRRWTASPSTRWKAREDLRTNGTTTSNWKAFLRNQEQQKEKEERDFDILQQERDAEGQRERNDQNLYVPCSNQRESTSETQYKVIVKAVDYILDAETAYDGEWHMEGMPHEQIIASAIYYYDTDENILDDGLSLRRLRDPFEDFPTTNDMRKLESEDFLINLLNDEPNDADNVASDDDTMTISLEFLRFAMDNTKSGEVPDITEHVDCPSDWEGCLDTDFELDLTGTISIGKVSTQRKKNFNGTGTIISLPNWVQHKVERVSNSITVSENVEDTPSTARRRILCFFLVDDTDLPDGVVTYPGFSYVCPFPNSIPTTSDIDTGSMPCLCNKATLRFLLPWICKHLIRNPLPAELVEIILDFVSFGVTREEAEAHRWGFKEERQRYVDRWDHISQPISDGLF